MKKERVEEEGTKAYQRDGTSILVGRSDGGGSSNSTSYRILGSRGERSVVDEALERPNRPDLGRSSDDSVDINPDDEVLAPSGQIRQPMVTPPWRWR
ncbi:hypothetical protein M6B38_221685 [Iris pallida]|uniref:Uncharacterized protein n=1 Tax=Iris pallida TaxID=29817 RepID=A0AAX6DWD6_IRIPA|nr:hypothetical protein M6B38_221685 [Iris pallida]